MNDHRYILEPYKGIRSRYTCAGCGHKHKFTRYIDTSTGEQLADYAGRCERKNNCGYHFTPKQFFANNPGSFICAPSQKQEPVKPVCYLPFEIFEKSIMQHERCDLYPFLEKLFRKDVAKFLCEKYCIGSNKEGDTVFWQVDVNRLIRQCKVMCYKPDGHRDKSKQITFAGKKILNDQEANLQQCFFGEYLLSLPENKGKPVAIVESEKTAVIASIYFPEFVFIATGGMYGANWTSKNVCKVLQGRNLVLFPDLGAFDKWKDRGKLLASVAMCRVATSDVLEKAGEADRIDGLDIADYLLREQDSSGLALTDHKYPVFWDGY